MREEGIDGETDNRIMSLPELLDDPDAVDDDLRASAAEDGEERINGGNINAGEGVILAKEMKAGVRRDRATESDPDVMTVVERTPELMAEHAGATDDQNSHRAEKGITWLWAE